jgi:hypothetical protein
MSKSILELLGEDRMREIENHVAERYGKPSLMERFWQWVAA